MNQGRRAIETVSEVLLTVIRYVGGQAIIALLLSTLYFLAFYLLKVPGWYLLAPLCGLFHLIPVIGVILGAVVPLAVLAIAGTNWPQAAAVLGVFAIANLLETFALNPLVHGKRLRLHPAAVFFAALAGGMFFGFVGALVAVPLLAAAAVVWRRHRAAPE